MSEDHVQEAVETAKDVVNDINPATASTVMRNVGAGFVAISLAAMTASVGIAKFRTAWAAQKAANA